MYYALVHKKTQKRVDFGNKAELIRWIEQHGSLLTAKTARFWYLYRTQKTPFNFCNRILSSYLCTLFEYIVKHNLLNYGRK